VAQSEQVALDRPGHLVCSMMLPSWTPGWIGLDADLNGPEAGFAL
jgi:hypothetical protein